MPTAVGNVILRAEDPVSGCGDTVTALVECPLPSVTTRWPLPGQTYGTAPATMGPQLPWHAEAQDGLGADPLDTAEIQRVDFRIAPDPVGFGVHSEFNLEYCGFGGVDCFATPGNASGWPSGTYTLTAEAFNTCGASATDSVTITVDNP